MPVSKTWLKTYNPSNWSLYSVQAVIICFGSVIQNIGSEICPCLHEKVLHALRVAIFISFVKRCLSFSLQYNVRQNSLLKTNKLKKDNNKQIKIWQIFK